MSDYFRHDPLLADIRLVESGWYWWYRFMQYLPNYGPEHPLWLDFGDTAVEFEDWYVEIIGAWNGTTFPIMEFGDIGELSAYKEKKEELYGIKTTMLALHPHYSRRQLTKQFREILARQLQYSLIERPSIRFHTPPKVKALRNTFSCYYLKQKLEEFGIRATNYEMLQAVGLLSANNAIADGDTKYEIADKKNRAGATFGRYIIKAERLISNIGEGRFPDYR